MSKVIAFDRERRRSGSAEFESRYAGAGGKPSPRGISAPSGRDDAYPDGVRAGADGIVVSVVVPTKGRPQLINRCVASLVLQNFDRSRFEIVVVDDGPDPATCGVVNGWIEHTDGQGPRIVYIPSPGPHGPAAARNLGWRAARGSIVAFTDDDTIACADWLKNGVREFKEGVDTVCGRVIMPLSGTPTDYQLDAKNLESAEFVTANCLCRKTVLEAVGGFDERFRYAWREDSDLHFKLLEHCAQIVHSARAVIMHPIRPAGWGVSLSQLKKIQFDALLYKKHPQLYRRRIRATPRWDFYLTVAALIVAVTGALLQAGTPAAAAGLVWLFMTGRFCVQRLRRTSKSPAHVLEMAITSALIPPLAVFWRAVGALRFRVAFL